MRGIVQLATGHASKGSERDTVYILEPSSMMLESNLRQGGLAAEDEKHVKHVMVSRARRRLVGWFETDDSRRLVVPRKTTPQGRSILEPWPQLWWEGRRSPKHRCAPESQPLSKRIKTGGFVRPVLAQSAVLGKGRADLGGPRVPLRSAEAPLAGPRCTLLHQLRDLVKLPRCVCVVDHVTRVELRKTCQTRSRLGDKGVAW